MGRTQPRKKGSKPKRRRLDQAVAYVRVSSDRQLVGPEAQRRVINEWADRNSCEVVAWYDDCLSGYLNVWERPGLTKALLCFEQGVAGQLVFAQRDRLARDPFQMQLIQHLVGQLGGRLVAADGVANGEGPFGDFARLVLDGVAGLERAMTGLRTRAVFQIRRDRGEACGPSAPFGFARKGLQLIPDPAEQETLQEIAQYRQLGFGLGTIAELLQERGPRGRQGYLGVGQIGKICNRIKACGSADFTSLEYRRVAGAQTLAQLAQRRKG